MPRLDAVAKGREIQVVSQGSELWSWTSIVKMSIRIDRRKVVGGRK